jgi:phosphatidylinositol alpha-mannosyltransferase
MKLLEAINYILKNSLTSKTFNVDIYGRGELELKLKEYVSQNNMQNIVSFHGFIDEEEKPVALARADIAVFPSIGAESFGIVLIEAMAAGSGVVLGGNNPGYRTVLGETPDALVNPHETQAFARQLVAFLENKALRSAVHAMQQQMVKQYDIEVVGPKLVELYCKNLQNT